jgi:hypothetical protein
LPAGDDDQQIFSDSAQQASTVDNSLQHVDQQLNEIQTTDQQLKPFTDDTIVTPNRDNLRRRRRPFTR